MGFLEGALVHNGLKGSPQRAAQRLPNHYPDSAILRNPWVAESW